MTVRLTIRTATWRAHVARVAASVDGLVPVVKGNGYGFGRAQLASLAAEISDTIAVGNLHELDGLPASTYVVLTPTLAAPASTDPILTVGNERHVDALRGWEGRVIVKLASDMARYGRDVTLVDTARAAGLDVVGVSLHPSLSGSADEHVTTIATAIADVPTDIAVWVSHLDPDSFRRLPASHDYRLRLGTALWHGDKSTLALSADVLDVRPIAGGAGAGYRLRSVHEDGHLVMIGAGTANGIAMIDQGTGPSLSPFHFARTRLALHEPPHMHTSMAFVPDGGPLPAIGERVDVQRPLHMTTVDEYEWL